MGAAALLLVRVAVTGGAWHYRWLLAPNLVLAWIPLLAALFLDSLLEARRGGWALWFPLYFVGAFGPVLLALYLLFYRLLERRA